MSNFRARRGLKLFSCEWFSEFNVLIFIFSLPAVLDALFGILWAKKPFPMFYEGFLTG
ncbi:hypothetical protein C8J57DRAFT_1504434 [Mycena rebaudengoi]|nr:hypothetical protein C8J57DRAFT_1504434 [Mycena rebaudengoi]